MGDEVASLTTREALIRLVEILAKPLQAGGMGMSDSADDPIGKLLLELKRGADHD